MPFCSTPFGLSGAKESKLESKRVLKLIIAERTSAIIQIHRFTLIFVCETSLERIRSSSQSTRSACWPPLTPLPHWLPQSSRLGMAAFCFGSAVWVLIGFGRSCRIYGFEQIRLHRPGGWTVSFVAHSHSSDAIVAAANTSVQRRSAGFPPVPSRATEERDPQGELHKINSASLIHSESLNREK